MLKQKRTQHGALRNSTRIVSIRSRSTFFLTCWWLRYDFWGSLSQGLLRYIFSLAPFPILISFLVFIASLFSALNFQSNFSVRVFSIILTCFCSIFISFNYSTFSRIHLTSPALISNFSGSRSASFIFSNILISHLFFSLSSRMQFPTFLASCFLFSSSCVPHCSYFIIILFSLCFFFLPFLSFLIFSCVPFQSKFPPHPLSISHLSSPSFLPFLPSSNLLVAICSRCLWAVDYHQTPSDYSPSPCVILGCLAGSAETSRRMVPAGDLKAALVLLFGAECFLFGVLMNPPSHRQPVQTCRVTVGIKSQRI